MGEPSAPLPRRFGRRDPDAELVGRVEERCLQHRPGREPSGAVDVADDPERALVGAGTDHRDVGQVVVSIHHVVEDLDQRRIRADGTFCVDPRRPGPPPQRRPERVGVRRTTLPDAGRAGLDPLRQLVRAGAQLEQRRRLARDHVVELLVEIAQPTQVGVDAVPATRLLTEDRGPDRDEPDGAGDDAEGGVARTDDGERQADGHRADPSDHLPQHAATTPGGRLRWIDPLHIVGGLGHTVLGSWLSRLDRRFGQRLPSAAGSEDASPEPTTRSSPGCGPVDDHRSSGSTRRRRGGTGRTGRRRRRAPRRARGSPRPPWRAVRRRRRRSRTGSSPPDGRARRGDRPTCARGEGELRPRRAELDDRAVGQQRSASKGTSAHRGPVGRLAVLELGTGGTEVDRGVHPRHGGVVESEVARRVASDPHAVAQLDHPIATLLVDPQRRARRCVVEASESQHPEVAAGEPDPFTGTERPRAHDLDVVDDRPRRRVEVAYRQAVGCRLDRARGGD